MISTLIDGVNMREKWNNDREKLVSMSFTHKMRNELSVQQPSNKQVVMVRYIQLTLHIEHQHANIMAHLNWQYLPIDAAQSRW